VMGACSFTQRFLGAESRAVNSCIFKEKNWLSS